MAQVEEFHPPSTGKPKVAILGVLANLNASYSVAGVVLLQLRLLKKHGYDVVLITTSDFESYDALPDGVEVRLYDRFHGKITDEKRCAKFDKYTKDTGQVLTQLLLDCDVCITHDVIFIRDYVPVNWAMRIASAKLPRLRWLHWMHSAPGPRPSSKDLRYPFTACYSGMRNSRYIYVNRTDIPRVARMYNVPEAHVRTVHNMVDPCQIFRFHPLSAELYEILELDKADTIIVYPTRLVEAKQVDKLVKLVGSLKALDQEVRLVVCNSYSNAQNEKDLIEKLEGIAKEWGLRGNDLTFTSKLKSDWARLTSYNMELGVPHEVVVDLMRISDTFVLPSVSEACSIIMLEASLSKHLMVLNRDMLSLLEFGGQMMSENASEKAVYFSFGSLTRPVGSYRPDERSWFADHARSLMEFQRQDRVLQFFRYTRKHHHPNWVFQNHLEPLLSGC